MNSRFRTTAAAVTLATICLAEPLEELLRPTRDQIYHWSGNPSALFGPPLIMFIVVAGLFTAILISAERSGYWRATVWTAVVLFLPWLIVHEMANVWPQYLPSWVWIPSHLLLFLLISWPVIAVVTYRFARRQWEAVIETASVLLAFTALSSVLFVLQLLWLWWSARDLNNPMPMHAAAASAPVQVRPRIIWIVLDELSYQQIYEHRYPGVELPAFDALAETSTVFTQVTATSNRTEMALPALLSGHAVAQMSATSHGLLLVRSSPAAAWHPFDERDTVFSDALRAGYKTAVAGWYNPYCRILHDVLDSCYWTDANAAASFRGNLIRSTDNVVNTTELRHFLAASLHVPDHLAERNKVHISDYLSLRSAAERVLLDRRMTFTFLHLPIPHPDGIYNRRTAKLTPIGGTYIDNLALSDRWLGQTRALLEATGQWDGSTVILMGDHGWRTKILWAKVDKWTAEEQRASLGGQFDPRPAYIVKLAGQTKGERIDEPFDAIRTRALVDELLAGRIHSPEDLKNWVDHGQETNENFARGAHP